MRSCGTESRTRPRQRLAKARAQSSRQQHCQNLLRKGRELLDATTGTSLGLRQHSREVAGSADKAANLPDVAVNNVKLMRTGPSLRQNCSRRFPRQRPRQRKSCQPSDWGQRLAAKTRGENAIRGRANRIPSYRAILEEETRRIRILRTRP